MEIVLLNFTQARYLSKYDEVHSTPVSLQYSPGNNQIKHICL